MAKNRLVLRFPKESVEKPIISHLVKDYNLDFSILKAAITPNEEGVMVLEIEGDKNSISKGIKFLTDNNVGIEELTKDIQMNPDKCTACGACITICPSEALYRDPENFNIVFESDKCIACELCVSGCPYRAMEVQF